jgi:hypothetical protein
MNRSRKTSGLGRALALVFGVMFAFALIEIAGWLMVGFKWLRHAEFVLLKKPS